MKATYVRHIQENLLEELGEDNISFRVFFKTENELVCSIPIILFYEDLLYSLKETDEEIYTYLKKIRSNIHGYGLKHSKIFEVLNNEGFDIQPYLVRYISQLDEDFINAHLEWVARISTPENQANAQKNIATIKNSLPSNYAQYNIKLNQFRDDVDQKLHELTFNYFPELFEKSDDVLKTYKNTLINTTLDFSRQIDKLNH